MSADRNYRQCRRFTNKPRNSLDLIRGQTGAALPRALSRAGAGLNWIADQAAFAKVSTATATRAVSGAIACSVSLTDASATFFASDTTLEIEAWACAP